MGGNGARAAYDNYTLDVYSKDRFKQVGIIGNTKVVTSRTKNNNSTPMNSFGSSMYYVTNPNDTTRITTIAFYYNRTHEIVKSIDLKYDKDGNLLPFQNYIHKGKVRNKGVHFHYWPEKYKGDAGRVQHDPNNFFEPTKTEWRYIKKAIKYNEKHKNDKP